MDGPPPFCQVKKWACLVIHEPTLLSLGGAGLGCEGYKTNFIYARPEQGRPFVGITIAFPIVQEPSVIINRETLLDPQQANLVFRAAIYAENLGEVESENVADADRQLYGLQPSPKGYLRVTVHGRVSVCGWPSPFTGNEVDEAIVSNGGAFPGLGFGLEHFMHANSLTFIVRPINMNGIVQQVRNQPPFDYNLGKRTDWDLRRFMRDIPRTKRPKAWPALVHGEDSDLQTLLILVHSIVQDILPLLRDVQALREIPLN
jgi:hypothetical protein